MRKVAVTTSSFAEYDKGPLLLLEERGFSVALNPYGRKLTPKETVDFCAGMCGIIAGTELYDAHVLESLTHGVPDRLLALSRCGTGMDNVDVRTAERLGIKVANTPDAPTCAVAELTVGYILDLLRQVTRMDRELRAGQWKKRMGNLLQGKKVGVIKGTTNQELAEIQRQVIAEGGPALLFTNVAGGRFQDHRSKSNYHYYLYPYCHQCCWKCYCTNNGYLEFSINSNL